MKNRVFNSVMKPDRALVFWFDECFFWVNLCKMHCKNKFGPFQYFFVKFMGLLFYLTPKVFDHSLYESASSLGTNIYLILVDFEKWTDI